MIVPSPNAETEVRQTLSNFIQAFDNLDWEKFRNAFAEDATVFCPREFPHRANGRAEIEANFRHVFEQIRGQASKPPYMDIQPRELHIQMLGDVAIAMFHLDDRPGVLNRRTNPVQDSRWMEDCSLTRIGSSASGAIGRCFKCV